MGFIIGDHVTPTLNDIVYWDGSKWALRPGWFSGDVSPIFDDTIIFGPAAKGAAWEDLDCGVGQAVVYLEVTIAAAEAAGAQFRPNDETIANFAENINNANFNAAGPATTLAYAMCVTDSAGLVEWRYTGGNNVTIRRIGYWPLAPAERTLLYSAQAGTGAYQTIDLGIPNALVIVMMEMVSGGANIYGRWKGETVTSSYGTTYSSPAVAGHAAMLLFLTDANGEVEINWNVGVTANIYRLSYITRLTNYGREDITGGGVNPPAAWTDLDCNMGQAFLYLSDEHTVGAGFDAVVFRRNGGPAADVYGDTALVATNVGLNMLGYLFIPVDLDGLVEWKGNNADTVILRRMAALR